MPAAALRHPPCPRCSSEVEVQRPWRGYRSLRVVWFGGLAVIVTFAPILASDLVVMMPLSVLYLFAGGPVLGFAAQTPTCSECGLARPKPGLGERPLRPARLVRNGFSRLRVRPEPPAPSSTEESGVRPLPKRPEKDSS
jgi:hypothetical protein